MSPESGHEVGVPLAIANGLRAEAARYSLEPDLVAVHRRATRHARRRHAVTLIAAAAFLGSAVGLVTRTGGEPSDNQVASAPGLSAPLLLERRGDLVEVYANGQEFTRYEGNPDLDSIVAWTVLPTGELVVQVRRDGGDDEPDHDRLIEVDGSATIITQTELPTDLFDVRLLGAGSEPHDVLLLAAESSGSETYRVARFDLEARQLQTISTGLEPDRFTDVDSVGDVLVAVDGGCPGVASFDAATLREVASIVPAICRTAQPWVPYAVELSEPNGQLVAVIWRPNSGSAASADRLTVHRVATGQVVYDAEVQDGMIAAAGWSGDLTLWVASTSRVTLPAGDALAVRTVRISDEFAPPHPQRTRPTTTTIEGG